MLSHLKIRKKNPDESWGQYYAAHHLPFGILSFICGFTFDAIMVPDIEELHCILQQIGYLLFVGWVLYLEILESAGDWKPGPRFAKFWNYREGFAHFFLGTLLNIYSIFYFKSASLSSSIYFFIFLFVLLIINEAPSLRNRGPIVRLGIWTLCASSFYVVVIPLLFGFGGPVPFAVSLLSAAVTLYLFYKIVQRHEHLRTNQLHLLFLPAVAVLPLYLAFYVLKLVPPVPLALKQIGIYHNIEKVNGEYVLTEEKPWWRFWNNGDQMFYAKPGDKIFVYAAIHSPTKFADEVRIQWFYKDPRRGWQLSDNIPLQIHGGRHEGFRGYAYKSNYQPGDWRVSIQTLDGLEIGQINLEVIPAG